MSDELEPLWSDERIAEWVKWTLDEDEAQRMAVSMQKVRDEYEANRRAPVANHATAGVGQRWEVVRWQSSRTAICRLVDDTPTDAPQ
jgi:hypothetical protein